MFPHTKKYPKCESGRKCMNLKDRQMHFLTCSHPQCVYLLAFYRRVTEEVCRKLSTPTKEKCRGQA